MLPPLFGVSWGMYPIIVGVLVLLVVVLLIVSQRKKKGAVSTRAKAAPESRSASNRRLTRADKTAAYEESRRSGAGVPAAPYSPQQAYSAGAPDLPALPQTPLPPVGYVPPGMPPMLPTAPPPRVHSVPFEDILPGSDPLQAIILELLSGWGDLTQEDTNRLGVFRPDRVMAAVASADVPKELRGNEHARARLSQLRRWASGLEHYAARGAQPVSAVLPEYAAINAVPPSMAAPPAPSFFAPAAPAMAAVPVVAAPLAAIVPSVAAQAPVAPAAAPQPQPQMQPPLQQPTGYLNATPTNQQAQAFQPAQAPVASAPPAPIGIPPAPTPESVPQTAPYAEPKPTPEPALAAPAPAVGIGPGPLRTDMVEANRSTEAAIAAAAAAFWARPELGGTLPDATPLEPQTPPLAPPMPQTPSTQDSVPVQTAPQAPASFPIGQELPTLVVPTPVVAAPSVAPLEMVTQHSSVGARDSDTFLEDLGVSRVSTAESLLALPPAEQPGLLAFLKPSELARVLQATGDSELKKAVIDTLESVGSPSALDIIYRCLDDPDPQVQAKALEAADRLLGAQ
jgi:hypothetical protein